MAYLTLDVLYPVSREAKLVQRDLCFLEVAKESKFALEQKEKTFADFASTSSPPDTMNVLARIIRRVELDDPIDARDIQSTGGDVCGQQNTRLGVDELKESICPLLLFLIAL